MKGLCAQMRSKKLPWRPADVLTTDEVRKMHVFLGDSSNALPDSAICGHFLHLLYMLSVQEMYVDPEHRYLELVTTSRKGARNSEIKSRLLPLVSP